MGGEQSVHAPLVVIDRPSRHLVIASTRGHVATFDWQAGRLNSEIQLKETVRDIKLVLDGRDKEVADIDLS